jgi:hypothetical protein
MTADRILREIVKKWTIRAGVLGTAHMGPAPKREWRDFHAAVGRITGEKKGQVYVWPRKWQGEEPVKRLILPCLRTETLVVTDRENAQRARRVLGSRKLIEIAHVMYDGKPAIVRLAVGYGRTLESWAQDEERAKAVLKALSSA